MTPAELEDHLHGKFKKQGRTPRIMEVLDEMRQGTHAEHVDRIVQALYDPDIPSQRIQEALHAMDFTIHHWSIHQWRKAQGVELIDGRKSEFRARR